jgi:hypothetical protein
MTFALTGGETGEARLLDLLFCLVTRRPHRIHHCRMARTRRQLPNSPTFTAVPSFRLKSDAAALSTPSRDAWRRCDLNEANLLQIVTRGVVAALSKPIS